MSLRTVNLNLLPALRALLTEGSVTRAAESLGISQSAMSDALTRLRTTFNDPLLVRVGRRMALSPRAIGLIPEVRRVSDDLQSLFVRQGFDPCTATRRFVIATTDFGGLLVARKWLDRLAVQAPHVALRFVGIDKRLSDKMATGAVDFAILPELLLRHSPTAPLEMLPFSSMPLGGDTLAALFCVGHPLDDGVAIGRDQLSPFRIHTFHPDIDAVERRYSKIFSRGIDVQSVLSVPNLAMLPFVLLDSQDVALIPERLGTMIQRVLPLRSAPLDFAPEQLRIVLAWSKAQDSDLAHCWFRRNIASD